MKQRFLVPLILGIIISFLIYIIHWIELANLNKIKNINVIGLNQTLYLTEKNLVDYLVNIDLQSKIRSVKFNNSNLYIDLYALNSSIDMDKVYKDLYILTIDTLTSTKNVENIYIRVFLQSNNLLIALSANKNDVKNKYNKINQEEQYKNFLESNFNIIYGDVWKNK